MGRRASKQAIATGAAAHYRDAAYYDRIYRKRTRDVAYYVAQALARGGPVLELGCGSGRVSMALAEAGVSVVGVDPLEEMLEAARHKRDQAPGEVRALLQLVRGDMRSVRLARRFALVIAPFNVFMHLYDRRDLERALETVRAHLRRGGRLIFDVSMPDYRALLRDPHRPYRSKDVRDPASGTRYGYEELFAHDARRQVQHVSMIFTNRADEADVRVTPLSQRLFFPAELEALLHYNGFAVESLTGDFRSVGLSADDESMVVVARARRTAGP